MAKPKGPPSPGTVSIQSASAALDAGSRGPLGRQRLVRRAGGGLARFDPHTQRSRNYNTKQIGAWWCFGNQCLPSKVSLAVGSKRRGRGPPSRGNGGPGEPTVFLKGPGPPLPLQQKSPRQSLPRAQFEHREKKPDNVGTSTVYHLCRSASISTGDGRPRPRAMHR
jgi:hypothetical protein